MSRRNVISENQLALPFRQGGARAISYDQRVRFFWLLACVSIGSLVLYMYSIQATAQNIAVRQELQARGAEASGKLGALEFTYIELKNGVSMELASHYGFQEAEAPLYVSRNQPSALTLNTDTR